MTTIEVYEINAELIKEFAEKEHKSIEEMVLSMVCEYIKAH